jgi:hypothetical protein
VDLHIEAEPSEERGAADWLVAAGLPGSGAGVASFVPGGFAAYARILHPARLGDRDASWAEIARWSGRALRADSDSKDLMVRADGASWESVPEQQRPEEGTGGLDDARLDRLVALLAGSTSTLQTVWTLFDEIEYELPPERSGYRAASARRRRRRRLRRYRPDGPLRPDGRLARRQFERMRALEARCGVTLAGHRFILHGASISDADGPVRHPRLPGYWWPADRAWVVHTNVDCPSTYVAGSRELLQALLADELLEVVEARLDDPFDGHEV